MRSGITSTYLGDQWIEAPVGWLIDIEERVEKHTTTPEKELE
jgi:hypothetical protein